MIAADTSTWIAYFQGDQGEDVRLLDRALLHNQVLMPPVVLAELCSSPNLPSDLASFLAAFPLLPVEPGFWQRAGALRGQVLSRRRKARLGDALIAQSCIDHRTPLITRDQDFRAFTEVAALDVVFSYPQR